MIAEVLAALVSIVLLASTVVIQPRTARCPGGMYLAHGVQPGGAFICQRPPRGLENDGELQPGTLRGRIHCTGGTRPIVVTERVVGCQRGRS